MFQNIQEGALFPLLAPAATARRAVRRVASGGRRCGGVGSPEPFLTEESWPVGGRFGAALAVWAKPASNL